MERYTKWRDGGTGVAPFLPVSAPDFTTATLPLRVLTFLVRIPLIILTTLLFILVDTFFRFSLGSFSIAPVEFARAWTARALLFVSGVYRIPVTYDSRKVMLPQGGDVIICNQTSPMDIMILTYLYPSAVFLRCDNEMLFETQSALGAFFSRFRNDRVRKGCVINDLVSPQSQFRHRVIVIFPECTTSNNRGLLAFCPVMVEKAYVMSIKYNNPPYLSTPIPGSYWNFVWGLASVWSHGVRLKGTSQSLEHDHADALARLGRLPKTSLGIEDKQAFLAAWKRR